LSDDSRLEEYEESSKIKDPEKRLKAFAEESPSWMKDLFICIRCHRLGTLRRNGQSNNNYRLKCSADGCPRTHSYAMLKGELLRVARKLQKSSKDSALSDNTLLIEKKLGPIRIIGQSTPANQISKTQINNQR